MQSSCSAPRLFTAAFILATLCSTGLSSFNLAMAQAPEAISTETQSEPPNDMQIHRRARRKMMRERGRNIEGRAMKNRLSGPLDLSELNLTEEQKSKILAHRQKTKGKAKEVLQTLKEKRIELKEMMFDPEISATQIRAKRSEMRKLQDEAESIKLDDFLAIRTVLTAEQLKRLKPERGITATRPRRDGE